MLVMEESVRSDERISDESLIRQFQNGDMRAYNELVARYKSPLFNFILRYVNDGPTAEDILQETFLRLYRNKHYYKEVAKFSTWIYTIAANLAKTELRRRKRRTVFSINNYTEDNKDYEIKDTEQTPVEQVESDNTVSHIKQAIAELPDTFREVIILRDLRGLDYEEISQITDTPLGTVKSRINRGRAKLAEMLDYLIH